MNPPFQGLGLEDDFPVELIVDVRNPDIPCINYIDFIEEGKLGAYVILSFWDTYESGDENVMLWRSDDGGKSWYDFTGSTDIEWYGNRICYYYKEITDPIMLQLEVLSRGESNVVILYSIDGKAASAEGGDRDGGDRNTVPNSGGGNSTGSSGSENNVGNDSGKDASAGGSSVGGMGER